MEVSTNRSPTFWVLFSMFKEGERAKVLTAGQLVWAVMNCSTDGMVTEEGGMMAEMVLENRLAILLSQINLKL